MPVRAGAQHSGFCRTQGQGSTSQQLLQPQHQSTGSRSLQDLLTDLFLQGNKENASCLLPALERLALSGEDKLGRGRASARWLPAVPMVPSTESA